ncbi:MAG: hypothetical protein FRX49_06640 [Trebouxia sp. A1-2]|nr:MAG: hypothetical protein FRX49_06640 [Trebouxia sp. A1-2]
MDSGLVSTSLSIAPLSGDCKLSLPRVQTRRASRWLLSDPRLCRTGCACDVHHTFGTLQPARSVPTLGSNVSALQPPTPVPLVSPKVVITNTSARALPLGEPADSATQVCFLTSHRHVLPDGAELELVEMAARRDAQTKPAQPPLLFIHGASHGAWCFAENFLPWFAQRGYHCFAVSFRGHGTSSDQSACPDTYAQSRDDLAHVIASLPQQPVLIAHSMGGFFGQRYLIELADKQQVPPVAGVVMLASASLTASMPNMEWWNAQQSSMHAVKVIWWMMTSAVFKNASGDKEMLFSQDLPDADFQRYYEQLRSGRQALPANFKELRAFLPKAEACAEAAKQLPIPIAVMIAGDDAVIMRHQVEANAAYFGDTRWEQAAQTLHTWLQGISAPVEKT